MTAANDPTIPPPMTIIQRRHTTGTLASSSSSSDFELISIKPSSYTSLRDILPSPKNVVQSPKTPGYVAHSRYDILIRNRLVKEAAWAYLQPMSSSPEADGSSVLHRLWTQVSRAFVRVPMSSSPEADGSSVLHSLWTQVSCAFVRVVNAAFDCMLLSVRVGT